MTQATAICEAVSFRADNFGIDKSLWVAESEICAFDMSWNVCTDDIF